MNALHRNNLYDLTGKVILVTGGGIGIGLMITKAYVANGAKVYIASRKRDVIDKVAAELTKEGPGSCIALQANLATKEDCQALAAQIAEREERLHVLVNNSGITWGDSLENFPDNKWDEVMRLNVASVFNLTIACLPLLEKARSEGNIDPPRVINIASAAAYNHTEDDNAYSYVASKAAVVHLTKLLAAQLFRRGICVNDIAPGVFPSRMSRYFSRNEEAKKATLSSIPLGRFGSETDMAGLALLLASRAGAFINGASLLIDGGYTLRPYNASKI